MPENRGIHRFATLLEAIRVHHDVVDGNESGTDAELLERYPHLQEDLALLLEPAGEADGETARPPKRLGDYDLIRRIGTGAMGVVWEAFQRSLRRTVALKLLSAHAADRPESVARFHREATLAARIGHPGIVNVFGVGTAENTPFLAMEFIAGAPLHAVIGHLRTAGIAGANAGTLMEAVAAETRVPATAAGKPRDRSTAAWGGSYVDGVLRLVAQIADALECAHEAGIIHRDVKPSNVVVRPDGTCVLTDFGVAREEGVRGMTITGDFAGTLLYSSPEQHTMRPVEIDRRSDVFSLAVTLYELLTLSRPFLRETENEVKAAVIRHTPPRADKLDPAVDPALGAVVAKAMEKDRRHRYATAGQLASALRRYLAGDRVAPRPVPRTARVLGWARREPYVAGSLAGAFVILLAGFIVSTWLGLEAMRNLEMFDHMAVASDLRDAEARAARLYPATPERAPALAQWLEGHAEPLLAKRDEIQAALAQVEARSLEYSEEHRADDARMNPFRRPLARARVRLSGLRRALESVREARSIHGADTDEIAHAYEQLIDQVARRAGELEESTTTWRTWRFEDPRDRALYQELEGIISQLDSFQETAADVRERLRWARTVRGLTIGEPAAKWRRAIESIAAADGERASLDYRGMPELAPQVGLVPVGMDPASRLWEFWHPRSGKEPTRDERTGRLVAGEDTGLVFVLIPAGSFLMGSTEEELQNADEDLRPDPDELPRHRCDLGAFFLSKFELTQGQWTRLTRESNPSLYAPGMELPAGVVTTRHPVEQLSWVACEELLWRHGLVLPTEAQWEYACRAGTETPFHTGAAKTSLRGHANIADLAVRRVKMEWSGIADWLDDGHWVHAPVGSLLPNGYGLHDMHGNVYEWCRDWGSSDYLVAPEGETGLRPVASDVRVCRGGAFRDGVRLARSSARNAFQPELRYAHVGVRPARSVTFADPAK